MKDRLERHRFWNVPPRNPTQTRYVRFLKMPGGKLKTRFTNIQDSFNDALKNALKTRYSDILEG